MLVLRPEGFFGILAAVVALAFVLDYFFSKTRLTSTLPLMLLALLLVQIGFINTPRVEELQSISGFVSAFAIAVILLTVGLETDLSRLYRVIGRAMAWALACQITTVFVMTLVAYETFHWPLLWCFVFGFGVSGPSAIVVAALVRRMTMSEDLKTTLLFEAVIADVIVLVAPTILIMIYLQGSVSGPHVAGVVLVAVLGSLALGIGAGLLWVLALDRGRSVAKGYEWALTFTIALGLYSATAYLGLSGSLTIFLFGVIVGNAALLDARRGTDPSMAKTTMTRLLVRFRRAARPDTASIDLRHIRRVQTEMSFITGVFFFFYLGLLFEAPAPLDAYVVAILGLPLMIAIRFGFLPILNPLFDRSPEIAAQQRGLTALNVPRGLTAAVIATLVISVVSLPGFLDAIFLSILFTNIAVTIGIFLYYRPTAGAGKAGAEDGTPRPAEEMIPIVDPDPGGGS